MTQDGYGNHSICERDGCGKWFDYVYSYNPREPERTYPAWLKIDAGLLGGWMVYESTMVIDRGPEPAETYTMTYHEYFVAADDDPVRKLFIRNLGGEEGLSFKPDGTIRQMGEDGTWTQEDETTIKISITRTNGGYRERTFKVRDDGRLECTWQENSATSTIILAKVDGVENIL